MFFHKLTPHIRDLIHHVPEDISESGHEDDIGTEDSHHDNDDDDAYDDTQDHIYDGVEDDSDYGAMEIDFRPKPSSASKSKNLVELDVDEDEKSFGGSVSHQQQAEARC